MIVAAIPVAERSSSQMVHLYCEGFQKGRRPTVEVPVLSGFEHSMCGIEVVNERMPETNPVNPGGLRKHEHRTLSEARQIVAAGGYLRWCVACLGYAMREENLQGVVIGLLIDRQVRLAGDA